jgi:hypothetical protein
LVIRNGSECTLLQAGNGLATGHDRGEDVALHGNTEGERAHIQEKEVSSLGRGSLAREDTSLDGGTVGNGLIGVDALLELLAVEELGQKLLDTGDTGGTTDEDNLVNGLLVDRSILEDLGNRLNSAVEGLGVELFETSTGDGDAVVMAIEETVDLNGGLGTAGQSTLGTLASSTETTKGTGVTGEIGLGLAVEARG